MTREEAKEILRHWDDAGWLEYNDITCGQMFDALRKAEEALSEPVQEEFIDKACEWIANMPIEYSEFIEKGHCNWIADDFLKAMSNSLEFEGIKTCNSDKNLQELTWHKVSEELPPVDTEVVCKMKGVPFTEHFICKWDGKFWWYWNDCGQETQGWFGLNTGWKIVEWKEI